MASNIESTPVEGENEVQPRFVQTSADMNKLLNSSADKDRSRYTEPFQSHSSRMASSDGGRIFAEPPSSDHPSMQFAYEGQHVAPHRDYHRRDGGYFTTPVGYSHSSALPFGQGWSGHGIPWQTHPAFQQFDFLQQRILHLEQRSIDEGELNKGYYFFMAFFPSLFRDIELFEGIFGFRCLFLIPGFFL